MLYDTERCYKQYEVRYLYDIALQHFPDFIQAGYADVMRWKPAELLSNWQNPSLEQTRRDLIAFMS